MNPEIKFCLQMIGSGCVILIFSLVSYLLTGGARSFLRSFVVTLTTIIMIIHLFRLVWLL